MVPGDWRKVTAHDTAGFRRVEGTRLDNAPRVDFN
jgi:hypothetical protein